MRRAVGAVLAGSALLLGGCHATTGAPAATQADPSGAATLDGVDRQLDTIEHGLDADGAG